MPRIGFSGRICRTTPMEIGGEPVGIYAARALCWAFIDPVTRQDFEQAA